jgi:hypothetical protein
LVGCGGERGNARCAKVKETKDYRMIKTKGEVEVPRERGARRAPICFLYHTHSRREALRQRGMLLSYHLSAAAAKRRHINPSPAASLLCAVQPSPYWYLTRAPSRGVTWANGYSRVPAHLMRDGWMRSLYQSISLICTNSLQGTRDHPSQRASCARSAPRQHVLTSTITHRISKHPTLRLLNCSLARAGCNPEFCRPRTPSPKVHWLLLVTEMSLPAQQTAICRSLAELRMRPTELCAVS